MVVWAMAAAAIQAGRLRRPDVLAKEDPALEQVTRMGPRIGAGVVHCAVTESLSALGRDALTLCTGARRDRRSGSM